MNNVALHYQQPAPIFIYVGGQMPKAFPNPATSPATKNTEKKIHAFAQLPEGWHYGKGSRPSQEMIDTSAAWNSILIGFGFPKTDAFPGVSGEIMVTAYSGSHYVEVLIETTGVSLTYEKDGREVGSVEKVTPAEAYSALQYVVGEIWNISAYSIQGISTVTSKNLTAWPSKTRGAALPLSNAPALIPAALPSATTSDSIIQTSVESLPFFLSSTTPNSHMIRA